MVPQSFWKWLSAPPEQGFHDQNAEKAAWALRWERPFETQTAQHRSGTWRCPAGSLSLVFSSVTGLSNRVSWAP